MFSSSSRTDNHRDQGGLVKVAGEPQVITLVLQAIPLTDIAAAAMNCLET
ncbi:hypothetical protein [Desulfopila aestuarii]|uniref:Uncharacterized protein n=1 Tax=Desulfopila aestuarii DSM 18488 TaxID=1121416 RepID=A0A1M7YJJ6_9BACT|nr:hypothetical protein [Desulfopila aestuarii]SHO52799.1 hypothetical protein SAMN02745220_04771 [Desulfopila aestuarii DSM 18488]